MPHKFDPKNIALLDDPSRREWQSVEAFLNVLKPYPGMIYADIGCGVGYFTLPVAEKIGPEGKAYAVDIQQMMLKELKKRAKKRGIGNVVPILCSENKIPLPSSSIDIACLANTLHELEEPLAFIKEIRRILKQDGRLFVIDWKHVQTPFGPPLNDRVPIEKVFEILLGAGFKHICEHQIYPYHYVVEAEKVV